MKGIEPGKHPDKALSAAEIRGLSKPGMYADGGCLFLVVEPSGGKHWILRTTVKGKRRDIGLGGLSYVTLKDAREEAARLRKIARAGGDPVEQRRRERMTVPTLEEAAREFHAVNSKGFDQRHANRWITTLETYAFPAIGALAVDSVTSGDVLKVLTPIWLEIPESAKRIKQRLRAVFSYSKARGWMSGDNPAEDVTKVLPKQVSGADHHPALPYQEVPGFILAMRAADAALSVKLAFEFLILTAMRTSEVLLARWDQIDLEARTWTVPAEQMKGKATERRIPHRVPLAPRCLEILQEARELGEGDYVFPGRTYGRPCSNMIFLQCLKRMGRSEITAHGFRSSFRDWAEERNRYAHNVIEKCLAHRLQSKVEESYQRSDLLDLRRPLMEAWASFATAKPAEKVVKMRGA